MKVSCRRLVGFVVLLFAAICLLGNLAFALLKPKIEEDRLAIVALCHQFDRAIAEEEYEAAYEMMSPDYRETYSLEQFEDEAMYRSCLPPGKRPVVGVSTLRGKASIYGYPHGTLYAALLLEKVDGIWYFTGESRAYQG